MFATMDVLKKAVETNCNMIIVHEPVYYNGPDDTKMLTTDQVYLDKKKYIDDHNLVIWRFHDYIHRMKPDGIVTGMIRKLGWQDHVVSVPANMVAIPETSLKDLLQYLHKTFPGITFNVVGDPAMHLTGIGFSSGASGSRQHISMLEDPQINVVIAGEVPQWETYEYVRDAVSQGKNKAIILLGHVPSEEAGMEYASEWMKGFIKDIPVYFEESGPSYWTYPGIKK
jgi:putative NIF3 family GTP cyclohydrolase 1 type 2